MLFYCGAIWFVNIRFVEHTWFDTPLQTCGWPIDDGALRQVLQRAIAQHFSDAAKFRELNEQIDKVMNQNQPVLAKAAILANGKHMESLFVTRWPRSKLTWSN